ncbi:PQQ-dependent sugar dehydrogenase [Nonomuraea gerenzanensis]|uniref:Cytochrome c551/c552 n=1 Tax=Nonomuraea gerenzanensis TaxID=93944 RepID=A0A1M4EGJ3_9ACTN|nr:PQQ-dependent sugar dehydrogenase [Nonomuraea gerenzanensis]UBU09667.1 PQQ-dependent sugar dehydrogenase [Nonomuraea gerenzanensis]SBO98101.1 Cytochrome c551/c552 [Nonomuraea gerenzanensis]
MQRTLAVLGGLVLAGACLSLPAQAHDPATTWSSYEKITLTKNVGEPIDLAVLPDRRVLHTARNGDIRLTDPATGVTRIINTVPVYANSEDGLQTIALDPAFDQNKWVYLYYAPRTMTAPYPEATPAGSAPNTLPAGADETYWNQWKGYNQLSRFKWTGSALDLSTEQVIIKVETQRGQCCHVAGDLDWDADGNLYLATGDNTPAGTPGANGMAPNNDAPGMNPGLDARRGAGNSNDLRGKILRIKVAADGTYTVPEGNLFAPGTAGTRPEIFVTGVRNPFRMDVDAETGTLSWADYGPDAGTGDPARGPMGYVEWNITPLTKPMNSGWPYCTGDDFNYNDWNFATAQPGPWFDCAAGPRNTSRWNTGLAQLPPAVPADLYYGDNNTHQPAAWAGLTDFDPQTGQGPMGGPVYHYDPDNPAPGKLPAYWDGKAFFAEFSQDYLAAFTFTGADGPVTAIEHFLPNSALRTAAQPITDSPMDLEFGPDGSLYVLEYGDGFFRANPDAGLYRIDYTPANKTPQARIAADRTSSSAAPLTVAFDATASTDTEPGTLTYEWDFDGDGDFDATGVTATHTYTELGQYAARLRVTDSGGRAGLTSVEITVGNTAPVVTVKAPPNGGFFDWGNALPYQIGVSDAEDGDNPVCSRVQWTFGLGHDTHAHPETLGTGCAGAWPTPASAPEHGETENIYGVVVVSYRDNGAGSIPGALGEAALTLNPKLAQAEHADESSGVTETADDTASAKAKVTSFDAGDWIVYDPVHFAGITGVQTRASGAGTLALRWKSPAAEPFATVTVPAGDGWQTVTTPLTGLPEGTGRLYVTSSGGVEVDAFTFQGGGVADTTPPVVSATLTPAQPDGANGWYTGNVTLAVTATDNGTVASRQYSLDGATWSNANNPVTLSAEGARQVRYRATDNGGNVSAVGTLTVKIDKSNPTLTVTGVEPGPHGDSATLTPVLTGADTVSGVAGVTAELDGAAIGSGKPVALWTLPLGEHRLTGTVTDQAGRTATTTVTFSTTTSYADVRVLVSRFRQSGAITWRAAADLQEQLAQAERHEKKGKRALAIAALERFVKIAEKRGNVRDAAVRSALVRDADALIERLRQT